MLIYFSQVQRTVTTLKKSNISVGGGVKSSTFVRVKQEADATEGKGGLVSQGWVQTPE